MISGLRGCSGAFAQVCVSPVPPSPAEPAHRAPRPNAEYSDTSLRIAQTRRPKSSPAARAALLRACSLKKNIVSLYILPFLNTLIAMETMLLLVWEQPGGLHRCKIKINGSIEIQAVFQDLLWFWGWSPWARMREWLRN